MRQAVELKGRPASVASSRPVPGTKQCFACGWRSVKSFAGESYLVVRPVSTGPRRAPFGPRAGGGGAALLAVLVSPVMRDL